MIVFEAAVQAIRDGVQSAMATLIAVDGSTPGQSGARMLIRADGSITGTVGGGALEHHVRQQALEVISSGRPKRVSLNLLRDLNMACGGATEVFIEPLLVPPRLFVFGGGHIGFSLARAARPLGFRVVVVDNRPAFANPDRFPNCEVHCIDPIAWATELQTRADDYLVVTTHSHEFDYGVLEAQIERRWAYLGLIASRNKVVRFFNQLREDGHDDKWLRRVCTPIGLDIGAETVEEIAISIVAELIRVRRRCRRPPQAMSVIPLAARGGDGIAVAPRLAEE